MTEHPAYAAALETRARQIAADKMGLIKDPTGARLPDDIWRTALPQARAEPFQARVAPWMDATFGPEISADRQERAHRFLEEALELVQSTGTTESEARQLVAYVFGRPAGEPHQEVGGVEVTLAAFCLAHGLDKQEAGEVELARVWTKVEQIRAKQAAKPKHSPLPEHVESARPLLAQLAKRMIELGWTPPGDRWRHARRGSDYVEVGRATVQASTRHVEEGDTVVVYRGSDGTLWAREEEEFQDGRFERGEALDGVASGGEGSRG